MRRTTTRTATRRASPTLRRDIRTTIVAFASRLRSDAIMIARAVRALGQKKMMEMARTMKMTRRMSARCMNAATLAMMDGPMGLATAQLMSKMSALLSASKPVPVLVAQPVPQRNPRLTALMNRGYKL